MTTTHTIPAYAVRSALLSAILRMRNKGASPLLAAYTRTAPGDLDCHGGTAPHPGTVARARALAAAHSPGFDARIHMLDRGYIANVINRYRNRHGLAAVSETFGGATITQLRREDPCYLHGSNDIEVTKP